MKMLVTTANKIFESLFPLKIVAGVVDVDFTQQAASRILFAIESSVCILSTNFEPLYTNMYLIGPSDGTGWRYALKLEIYGVTSEKSHTYGASLYMYLFTCLLQIWA